MMKLSYEEAVAKIKEQAGLTEEQITSKINAKLSQFSGLVSKEGAAHILANELGIKLIEPQSAAASKLKVKNILSGMQNVEVLAKVLAVYPAKQFNTNGRAGQVGSLLMGDETGNIRTVFWNDQANKLSLLKKGDILNLKSAYVRENRNSELELHVNDRTIIVINPPGVTIDVQEIKRETARKRLGEIQDSDTFVEVLGTVIEVFDLRFFEVCPQCSKRAKPDGDLFMCGQHGPVTPNYSYVLNAFIDDSTASLRAVFFRDLAQKFLKKSHEELLSFRTDPQQFEAVKNEALGSFLRLRARVNKNEMFSRIELVVNDLSDARPEDAAQISQSVGEEKIE